MGALLRLVAVLGGLWVGVASASGRPIDPNDEQYQYGLRMARHACSSIAAELRDRWVHFDNFRVYRINFSVGLPVESYGCTIGAIHSNTGEVREVRAFIDRREGAERFTYRLGADTEVFQGCREEQMLDCMPKQ